MVDQGGDRRRRIATGSRVILAPHRPRPAVRDFVGWVKPTDHPDHLGDPLVGFTHPTTASLTSLRPAAPPRRPITAPPIAQPSPAAPSPARMVDQGGDRRRRIATGSRVILAPHRPRPAVRDFVGWVKPTDHPDHLGDPLVGFTHPTTASLT